MGKKVMGPKRKGYWFYHRKVELNYNEESQTVVRYVQFLVKKDAYEKFSKVAKWISASNSKLMRYMIEYVFRSEESRHEFLSWIRLQRLLGVKEYEAWGSAKDKQS